MSDDGLWLDMSVYPDTDPDTALSAHHLALLHDALPVDDAPLSDGAWDQMLATAVGYAGPDPVDEPIAPDPVDERVPAEEPDLVTTWEDTDGGHVDSHDPLHDHGFADDTHESILW